MRNFILQALLLGALSFTACQSNNSQEQAAEEAEANTETPAQETATDVSTTALLNPNLATAEELSAIEGMTDEAVQAVLDSRPFLNMTDFDLAVAEFFAPEARLELYSKVFVKLNLNTAPEAEIKLIPGVGDKMAHEFEEYRPYLKVEQFRREIGKYVDDEEVARLEQFVFVPVELNTATKAEILAIPGVGERMLHEFEEYRPYQSMEQFRREIGKYVDDKELARLERFVYLKD